LPERETDMSGIKIKRTGKAARESASRQPIGATALHR